MTPMTIESEAAELILKSDKLGRVRMPAERRDALLDEFERSGMSGQAFAKWAGVKYPTFASWRHERRRKGQKAEQPPAEVKWVEAVMPEPERSARQGSARMVIHLPGGVRVEACDGRAAAELLTALGVVRC